MLEELSGRPALHGPAVGDRIAERVFVDGPSVLVEILVVRVPLGVGDPEPAPACLFRADLGQGNGLLEFQAWHRLGELRHTEQRAPYQPGRSLRISAAHERVEPVLEGECPGSSHRPPLDEVAPRDLADRERLDDLRPVVPGVLRFPLPYA